MIIGVLSDTHGQIHPRVTPLFSEAAVERILHAGDVGAFIVIHELSKIAPVTAVCGNVDVSGNVALLPTEVREEIEGVSIYMTHIGGKPHPWYPKLATPKPQVAICGHSHIPLLEQYQQTLFLNPGAAGIQPRFNTPLSAALMTIADGQVSVEMITL